MSSESPLKILSTIILAFSAVTLAQPLMATSFTIADGEVVNTQQNLADYETGTIEAGGELRTGMGYAIFASGINNAVNNGGGVLSEGDFAGGIFSVGTDASIVNIGNISTTGRLSYGLASLGTNAKITNDGSIITAGDNAHGFGSSGDDSIITNSGSILTAGSGADGLISLGTNAKITNDGSIITSGNNLSGLSSFGNNSIITNSGSITTLGDFAHGVNLYGDGSTITNSGSITTVNDFAYGIDSYGDVTTITNGGRVSTTGKDSYGLYSPRANAKITNDGSIITAGDNAFGLGSYGDDSIITNSGSISTTGLNSDGLFVGGVNAKITNSGSIATAGSGAYGVVSYSDHHTITQTGDITTTGNFSTGLLSGADHSDITNSGQISTEGSYSDGIWLRGADIAIANSGSISTVGDISRGIISTAENATITNTGSISTLGGFSHGIFALGANATINNSGLISATGSTSAPVPYRGVSFLVGPSSSAAIWGSSNNITLNLLPGSRIIGRIDLGDDGGDLDTVNIYGNGASANLTFENTEVINLFGVNGVLGGNAVVTVDPTGESTRGVSLAKVTSAIHNVINQRMAQTTPLAPSRVVSRNLAPGMLFRERKPVAWIQAFGGESERDSEGSALEYEHDYQGVTLGYEMDYEGYRLGLMGGVVHSETETDIDSFETESDSYYLGGYGHFELGSVNLSATLLGGYSDYDNKRILWDNLNGREAAKSDFDGLFLSPSVTLSAAYAMNNHLELRPSASLNYSVAWLDSYREHGSTSSNLKVDDRTARALSARLQLAAAYKFTQYSEVEFRVGVDSRHTDDDDIDVNLAGSNFRYAATGDEDVAGGYAGLNLRFNSSENLSLIADVERGNASGDEDFASGHLTLEYRF